jgi:CDP-2,3-bis-(O-geranylgeranyl)-sn-glycerol synthase
MPIHAPLFGNHKTVRGFVAGIVIAVATSMVQYLLSPVWPALSHPLHASLQSAVVTGLLLGTGALGGDLLKSLLKRRVGIAPGKPWTPWDGIDYILGAIVLLSPLYVPTFWGAVFLIVLSPMASFLSNIIAFHLRLKETWH